jgi:hypothetical protein
MDPQQIERTVELALQHEDERVVSLAMRVLGLGVSVHPKLLSSLWLHFLFLPHESDLLFYGSMEAITFFVCKSNWSTILQSFDVMGMLDRAFASCNLFLLRATIEFVNKVSEFAEMDSLFIPRIVCLLNGDGEEQIRGLQFIAGVKPMLTRAELVSKVLDLCFSHDRNIQHHAVQIVCGSRFQVHPQEILDKLDQAPHWNGVVQILLVLQALILRGPYRDLWDLFVHDVGHLDGTCVYLTLPSGIGDIPPHVLLTLWYQVLSAGGPIDSLVQQNMLKALYEIIERVLDRKTSFAVLRLIEVMDPYLVNDIAMHILQVADRFETILSGKEWKSLLCIAIRGHQEEVYQWLKQSMLHSRWERQELAFETLGDYYVPTLSISRLEEDEILSRALTLLHAEYSSHRYLSVQFFRKVAIRDCNLLIHYEIPSRMEMERNALVLNEYLDLVQNLISSHHLLMTPLLWSQILQHEEYPVRLGAVQLMGVRLQKEPELHKTMLSIMNDDDSRIVRRKCIDILQSLVHKSEWMEYLSEADQSLLLQIDFPDLLERNAFEHVYQEVLDMSDSIIEERDPLNEGNNVLFCYDC